MKRLLSLFLISALCVSPALASEKSQCARKVTQIARIGWGDMMYETAVWYNNATKSNYRHIGHIFGEYQYPIYDWMSVGGKADWSMVAWDTTQNNGENFHNISIMPEIRFTYYRRGRVEMYSGLGIGLNVNTGSELDWKGRTTVCAPAFDITAYGISVGCEHWFCSFEIGGLNSFNNIKNEIYMLGSRIFTVSIGYRL